jgi:hypothetical protein
MLRSMLIGLAVAALLQVGVHSFAPASDLSLASHRIDWVSVQANTLTRLLCANWASLTR